MKIYNVVYIWENDNANESGDVKILLSTTDQQKAKLKLYEKSTELVKYYNGNFSESDIEYFSVGEDNFYMTAGDAITENVLIVESELQ